MGRAGTVGIGLCCPVTWGDSCRRVDWVRAAAGVLCAPVGTRGSGVGYGCGLVGKARMSWAQKLKVGWLRGLRHLSRTPVAGCMCWVVDVLVPPGFATTVKADPTGTRARGDAVGAVRARRLRCGVAGQAPAGAAAAGSSCRKLEQAVKVLSVWNIRGKCALR